MKHICMLFINLNTHWWTYLHTEGRKGCYRCGHSSDCKCLAAGIGRPTAGHISSRIQTARSDFAALHKHLQKPTWSPHESFVSSFSSDAVSHSVDGFDYKQNCGVLSTEDYHWQIHLYIATSNLNSVRTEHTHTLIPSYLAAISVGASY